MSKYASGVQEFKALIALDAMNQHIKKRQIAVKAMDDLLKKRAAVET